jgi:peptide/nickel transport system substrate-binding protein
VFQRLRDSERATYALAYGSSMELTVNPAGPHFANGELNPFHVREIREALNPLINRRYIAEELYGGLAVPRYLPLNTVFPDYARLADVARALELRYQHDPEGAERVIHREMERLGASRENGQWMYQGQPVRVSVLIRTEDARKRVGDYVANLMEDLGFRVERLYRTAEEASRIWIAGDPQPDAGTCIPRLGLHRDQPRPRRQLQLLLHAARPAGTALAGLHAGSGVRRDRGPPAAPGLRGLGRTPGADDACAGTGDGRLGAHLGRRSAERVAAFPRRRAGGGSGGRDLRLAALALYDPLPGSGRRHRRVRRPSLLTEPWNPVAGSNWIFDTMIIRALSDIELVPDPFTGLYWPQRIDRAEVTVQDGCR